MLDTGKSFEEISNEYVCSVPMEYLNLKVLLNSPKSKYVGTPGFGALLEWL